MKIEERIVKNILGKKKQGKDTDGDGTSDGKDCQPKNTMRQDKITDIGLMRMHQNLSGQGYAIKKKQALENLKGKI